MSSEHIEKCGQAAASFIPRWGWSFACVLPKGHEGEHKQGGNCIKHGEYVGPQCPQWPDCVTPEPPGEKVQPCEHVSSYGGPATNRILNGKPMPDLPAGMRCCLNCGEDFKDEDAAEPKPTVPEDLRELHEHPHELSRENMRKLIERLGAAERRISVAEYDKHLIEWGAARIAELRDERDRLKEQLTDLRRKYEFHS